MILALVLALQILYRSIAKTNRRLALALVVGFFVLVTVLSLFFLPINMGLLVPFDQWQLRMWLQSWI
jgi:dolichyl-phosphate-mannose--protein O-mannosyl transferase